MSSRWLARLYIAVAIVAIVPIWSVRYLPTLDGPSHTYNSWILHELIRGTDGPIAEWFRIDWRPHPNWIGHAVMALLMFVVSPIIAEKLFVTGLVLLFLYGMWRWTGMAGDAGHSFAFLTVPFAYHLLFQFGFYNFCVGAALYFLIVAVWWGRRDRPTKGTIAIIAALLLLCYFSHAMPVALTIGSIGLLWAMTLRKRRLLVHARHLIAFVPVMPLLLWFGPVGGAYLRAGSKPTDLFMYMARMRILYSLDHFQLWFATGIAIVLATLIVATLARRRWSWSERDALILPCLVAVALYILSRYAVEDVHDRMALFVALTPFAWLDLRLSRRATAVLTIAFAALALAYTGYLISRYRFLASHIQVFVKSADAIGPRSTILPVLYETKPFDTLVPIYYHAIDYVALKREGVDIDNYEPVLGYFPIGLRPGVEPGDIFVVASPWSLNIASYAPRAQYVFVWRGDLDPGLPAKLAPFYTVVGGRDSGTVYRSTAMSTDVEYILLPLLGTTIDHGAPVGVLWRVEQSVRNTGRTPVTVVLSTCEPAACRFDLAPGASAPIAAKAPYAFAMVPRVDADSVQFTTILRRVDPGGGNAAVRVPAVRAREFRDGSLVIQHVPFTDPYRVALRLWTQGTRPQSVLVTLRDSSDRTFASKPLAIDGRGAGTLVDIVHDFGNVPQRREPVDLTVDAAGAKVWAFVSVNDPNVPAPTFHYPR